MIHRWLSFHAPIIAVVLCCWSTWGEAHRSGCHRWQTCPSHHREFSGQVAKAKDGDKLQVRHEGRTETIHLAGVDSPEPRQAFGSDATRLTSDLILRQDVTLSIRGRDYDRVVGDVILADGRQLSRELVKAGLAWWDRHYSSDETLAQLQAEAQVARRGLWADPNPIPPWEFRNQRKATPQEASHQRRLSCRGRLVSARYDPYLLRLALIGCWARNRAPLLAHIDCTRAHDRVPWIYLQNGRVPGAAHGVGDVHTFGRRTAIPGDLSHIENKRF